MLRADITKVPVRDGCFKCVMILDVFEHIIDKRSLIVEAHRIMSGSGILIITAPLPKATDGLGDKRQPYDRPIEFQRILRMISDLFTVEELLGYIWLPMPRISKIIETYIPIRVGFALFKSFPGLIPRSETILLILRKKEKAETR